MLTRPPELLSIQESVRLIFLLHYIKMIYKTSNLVSSENLFSLSE